MTNRMGIVIYFQNKKVLKEINKYNINITYVNQAGRYLAGYCDIDKFPTIKKELKKNKLIRKIEESLVEMPNIEKM